MTKCDTKALSSIADYAKSIAPKNIMVSYAQGTLIFKIYDDIKKDRESMLELRTKVAEYILENYIGRKWYIKKYNGYRVWRWYGDCSPNQINGLACGLRADLTETEKFDKLRGVKF